MAVVPFEAARTLTGGDASDPSGRLHGHGFLVRARAGGVAGWGGFPGGELGGLRDALARAVEPLDYRFLNDLVDEPTDERLADWLAERIDVPDLRLLGVQSTRHQGMDVGGTGAPLAWRRYALEAAHWLPNVPPGHKCGRLHGHGFRVVLHAAAGRQPVAYRTLDAAWAPVGALLDHRCLNDIPGLEVPTSELLAEWLWQQLRPSLPTLRYVTVFETGQCGATYDGAGFRIWKEFTLDSAVRLARAPAADPRRRIHGHTYTLRLHLEAPVDRVRGWTVDFGDVKALFEPVFARIDHQPLHELPGLADGDVASLARWLRAEAAPAQPSLMRLDLLETAGCGALLAWNGREPPPAA